MAGGWVHGPTSPKRKRKQDMSLLCSHMSAIFVLTVLLMPPGCVQVDPTVVEEELVLRVGHPAFQKGH